jgi:phosphatidylinositol alpha-1,6-mannosyltransferase
MRTVLVVSKPVAPPWHDSTKNLVRDLVENRQRFDYRILVPGGYQHPDGDGRPARLISEPIYAHAGAFQPALWQNARVLRRLLLAGGQTSSDLYHYLFAPNPLASSMARMVGAVRPRPTVQTVASSPRSYRRAGWLCFGDRVVTLSRFNRQRLQEAGVASERLCTIPPGIELVTERAESERAQARRETRRRHGLGDGPLVLYAGDLEFSDAASTVLEAAPAVLARVADAELLYACRLKTAAAREAETALRWRAGVMMATLGPRIHFKNQLPDFLDVLSAADVCVLPADDLYAKMDLPLVVLEAMARQVPVVVADADPIREAVEPLPGSPGEVPGLAVPPRDPARLAEALIGLLIDEKRRRAMGQAARRVAEGRYDRRVMARAYEDLYDDLLSHHSRPG